MSGITINIVRVGAGEVVDTVPEGTTYGEVLAKLQEDKDAANIQYQNRGQRLEDKADQKVQANDRIQGVPKNYKQG